MTYVFYVEGNKREGRYDIPNKLSQTINEETARNKYFGRKFVVKYSREKPKYNFLFLNKPIPDSLENCKSCKWKEPPF